VPEDSLYEGPREDMHRQVFVPFSQSGFPVGVAFYVRTSMDSKSMFTALRRKVRELDGGMPVYDMKTLERQLDETLSTERLIAVLSAAFGLLALADRRWQGREQARRAANGATNSASSARKCAAPFAKVGHASACQRPLAGASFLSF